MSKYTTEVRYICEVSAGLNDSTGFTGIDTVLDDCVDKVFDFDFPMFDENYRKVLEKKILRHYYTREICEETVGLWKLRLCDRLNMIMPYYNQMYKSELLTFNPLYDVNLVKSNTGKKDSEASNTLDSVSVTQSSSDSESENVITNAGNTKGNTASEEQSGQYDNSSRTDVYSDTPQGALTGLVDGDYLTNARKIDDTKNNIVNATGKTNVEQSTNNIENGKQKDSSKGNSSNTANSQGRNVVSDTESYVETVAGKQGSGSFSKLLEEFRKTFLNIDAMVIEELSDLFFGLW